MTQIGYVCKECSSTILEEKVELLIDTEIALENKEIDEYNKEAKIELEEQKKELAEISRKLEILHKRKYPKYDFYYGSDTCSLHNGKTWHIFKLDEVSDFVAYTKLYIVKQDSKPSAYFTLHLKLKHKKDDRHVVCPVCNVKNYLPLKQLCLR